MQYIESKHESRYSDSESKERAFLLSTLSEPSRWHILGVLLKYRKNISVTELVSTTNIAQPTVSHHLKILLYKGVVDYEKDGMETYYFIRDDTVQRMLGYLQELLPEKETEQ